MTNELPTNQSHRFQPLITVFTVIALITSGWLIGSRAGGLLVSSSAEVPSPPDRSRIAQPAPDAETDRTETEAEAEIDGVVVPEPVALGDSMDEAGMTRQSDQNVEAVAVQIEAGEATAEQQCRDIEAEVSLRWEDGRMTDADWDSRWEGFLSDEEYETILVPSLGANGTIASRGERPVFEGFSDEWVVENLDNSELITGADNCWELELYDFE